jgi:hypothetical protein
MAPEHPPERFGQLVEAATKTFIGRGYRTMREFGPNDGLTLLADELVPRAVPLLMPGIDHFLGPHEDQEIWGAAVMRVFLAEVAGQRNR